jgi:monofunctional glycosyltransferase
LFGVWPPPVWWQTHWPRRTAMMRHWDDPTQLSPAPLDAFAPSLQRMVIIAEDSRFRSHPGIDLVEIADALGVAPGTGMWGSLRAAWRGRDRLRGASTITQQLAKNLYLSPSRSAFRKLKEAVTALRLEGALSKDRILELYLNVAEFGPGLWGADAGARAYFGVPPARLGEEQAAALAATLPHPRTSNPLFHPARMLARRNLILARYHGIDVYIPQVEDSDLDSLILIPIPPPVIPIIPPELDTIPTPLDTIGTDTTQMDTTQDTTRLDAQAHSGEQKNKWWPGKPSPDHRSQLTVNRGASARLVH